MFDSRGLTDSLVEMWAHSIFFPGTDCVYEIAGKYLLVSERVCRPCYFEVLNMAEVLLRCAVVALPVILGQLNCNKTN